MIVMENIMMENKIKKRYPVLYSDKKDCCGCSACYSICPNKAIKLIPDKEGFLYPVVDKEKCVSCFACIRVCPFKAT